MLPGQPDNGAESDVKVIVPTKYKAGPAGEGKEKSPFSRNDKTRASLKDQMAERYNNKKHDVTSMLQKLQATATAGKPLSQLSFSVLVRCVQTVISFDFSQSTARYYMERYCVAISIGAST